VHLSPVDHHHHHQHYQPQQHQHHRQQKFTQFYSVQFVYLVIISTG